MQVNVELKCPSTIEGMKDLIHVWETQFPTGKLAGITNYLDVTLTLRMPPATQVIPPQLMDLRKEGEGEDAAP